MTSAKQIMHTGVACIGEHETVTTAAQHGFSADPVQRLAGSDSMMIGIAGLLSGGGH
jgi:hypothetical protein